MIGNLRAVFICSICVLFVQCRVIPKNEIEADLWYKITKGYKDYSSNKHVTEVDILTEDEEVRVRRAAYSDERRRWPGAIVPYIIDRSDQPITGNGEKVIRQAMNHIEEHTCVRFLPRTTEFNYVNFTRGKGCSSFVGRISRPSQEINIGENCEDFSVTVHEILHALGFFHEHSRLDRENYVIINQSNILPGFKEQFDKYRSTEDVTTLGLPYDKKSVLHYSNFLFTKHSPLRFRKEYMTIYSKEDYKEILGSTTGLSALDIKKVQKLYSCPEVSTTTATTTTSISTSRTTDKLSSVVSTNPVDVSTSTTSDISSTMKQATQSHSTVVFPVDTSTEENTSTTPDPNAAYQLKQSNFLYLLILLALCLIN